jgi:hypothetical protein
VAHRLLESLTQSDANHPKAGKEPDMNRPTLAIQAPATQTATAALRNIALVLSLTARVRDAMTAPAAAK